jgi:DNA-binding transcriptional regulator GbsR (MarR family)
MWGRDEDLGLAEGEHIYYVQFILNKEDLAIWENFVDLAGRSAQRLGMARSLGQVYAALYLSPRPLGLADLMNQLQISKGNASMSVRQLADWGAVERVWIKGDRRDYYEAREEFRDVLRHFLGAIIKPRVHSTESQLKELEAESKVRAKSGSDEAEFMHRRIAKIRSYQGKVSKILPLMEKAL